MCYPRLKFPQLLIKNCTHMSALFCCLLFILFIILFSFQGASSSFFRNQMWKPNSLDFHIYSRLGGDNRDRTDDPLLAKQVLSQLSYTPMPAPTVRRVSICIANLTDRWNSLSPSYYEIGSPFNRRFNGWWAQVDSNHRPHDYQSCALASWAMGPSCAALACAL